MQCQENVVRSHIRQPITNNFVSICSEWMAVNRKLDNSEKGWSLTKANLISVFVYFKIP